MRVARILTLIQACALGCTACAGGEAPRAEKTQTLTTRTPTLEELAELTYYDIVPEPVPLKDGRWEGPPFAAGGASRVVVELLDLHAFGDLNGDGIDDAAVLLAENSGGSGTRIWVAAVGAPLGRVTNFGSALVGDRSQIRSMDVTDQGWIHLELLEAGPEDAACCPAQQWTKDWALVEGQLKQVSALQEGTLSPASLGTGEWKLTDIALGEAAPENIPITIEFQDARVAGSSGCNNYFADFAAPDPGKIVFGAVGSTMKACPQEILDLEQRFQQQLHATTGYGFRLGKLALHWQDGDRQGTMLFAPKP